MNKFVIGLAALGLAAAATSANAATTITFLFGSPEGNLGTTESYTVLGHTITASGFDASGDPTDLFGKDEGLNEEGLGLANDPSGQDEIHHGFGFVQIDVLSLLGGTLGQFQMNSTTGGEIWSVFGSNVSGSYAGGPLISGGNQNVHNLPGFGSYRYYDFVTTGTGGGQNTLLHSISATVPEPATWALMIMGFGSAGAMLRRRRTLAL